MREIGYRAWLKEEKRFIYPKLIMVDFGIVAEIAYDDIDQSTNELIERRLIIEDVILEQFTGLRDKNRKRIYEGDIVKEVIEEKLTVWEVRYCQDECCFGLHYIRGALYGDSLLDSDSQYEVIGNIHENKDLLEYIEKDQKTE
nr:MAG TPA: YopX protein [Caudoviricetes sp.]